MTSPITHEKIIEVLREALEFYANPEVYKPHPHGLAFDRRDKSAAASVALETARDLYQRLQAEKEGGWDGSYWHLCNPDQPPVNRAGAAADKVVEAITSRQHVAPPASANAGTERATIAKPPFRGLTGAQREEVLKALASERQRGLAEGERIGIEKERAACSAEARRYASGYSEGSDGRNTFVLLADAIDNQDLIARALTGDPQA